MYHVFIVSYLFVSLLLFSSLIVVAVFSDTYFVLFFSRDFSFVYIAITDMSTEGWVSAAKKCMDKGRTGQGISIKLTIIINTMSNINQLMGVWCSG